MAKWLTNFRQRVQFATGPGGVTATLYWLRKVLLRQDTHLVLGVSLAATPANAPSGMTILHLSALSDMAALPDDLLRQIRANSEPALEDVVSQRGSIFAYIHGNQVACQLNIAVNRVTVNTPTRLQVSLGPSDAFLYELGTTPAYRRRGLATHFIATVSSILAANGFSRCICHVRATNVPSLAAFRASGWRPIGRIITNSHGMVVGCPGCAESGLVVTAL